MLKGQEIVKNRRETIQALNQAAAAELQAAFRYLFLSHYATGFHGQQVAEKFAASAKEEWEHTSNFMERIVQLGGTPFQKLSEVEKLSFSRALPTPKNPTDWKKMVKDSLQGERDAIEFYRKLMKVVHDDPVTNHLVRETLEDEVKDEHDLAGLLE
ncbi:MAG: ferritin [Acidobacteria bacterium]|nr:ferritin [Acidobacteriota bacterium]MCH8947599.1 ferritin [Acidobacteriota bacterium]